MTEKLDTELELKQIKQTRTKRITIPFRDSAIEKITRTNTTFGTKNYLAYNFDVSKGSSLKGLMLKFYKQTQKKSFVLSFWFNNRNEYYIVGSFPNIRCKDVERLCLDLASTHQDDRGIWIKNPNQTRIDEKRLVEKPDTTKAKGYTINEVIEAYCGAELPGEQTERGFSKDRKEGYRRAKSCRNWFRYMAGYNHRNTLVKFYDDDQGYGYPKFLSNYHLRIAKPKDMRDLFRKFPPGRGQIQDRVYYNRRKKQNYTIPASKNYSIYDSYIGKSLIHELKPGDIEHFIKDLTSTEVKKEYVKVFISLWMYARKRGWLGTDKKKIDCPFMDGGVYVRKEKKRYEDPYKKIAIEDPSHLELFWLCSEELSKQFPWKAELHEFMILTAIRKTEALRFKKEYIDFDKGVIYLPKGISKTNFQDEELPITPELEVVLRNILDLGNRPGLEHYKMIPWLFGTRKWGFDKYWDKKFRMSPDARLGGDENYIPALRKLMREKSGDPELLYAPKILRKTYITLSQQKHGGRSEITQQMSRHGSIDILNQHYNKPSIETKRTYASKVSKVFSFIQRRSA